MLAWNLETLQQFRNSSTVAVHRSVPVSPDRPYLVFVRSGSKPVEQPDWASAADKRSYDILANFYAPPDTGCWLLRQADYVTSGGLSKFHAAKHLLGPQLLDHYSGVFFLDDDVQTHFDPGGFATFVSEQGFALAQASLTPRSYSNHPITVNHPSCVWRETNFVEVMAPYFSTSLLRDAIGEFDRSISTWGLDVLWGSRYASQRMAVIDTFLMSHLRPIEPSGGAFYTYLRSIGVDPQQDLQMILRDLKLQHYVVSTRSAAFLSFYADS